MLTKSLLNKVPRITTIQPPVPELAHPNAGTPKLLRLNCRKLALQTRRDLLSSYSRIHSENPSICAPKLTIISVGDNSASEKFIDKKLKVLNRYNIESTLVTLPGDLSLECLKTEIRKWNDSPLYKIFLIKFS